MQFTKTILAVATMVLAVAASPVEKRTTPAQDAQQKCGNDLKASCCNSVTKSVAGVLGVNVGLGCTPIDGGFLTFDRSAVAPQC